MWYRPPSLYTLIPAHRLCRFRGLNRIPIATRRRKWRGVPRQGKPTYDLIPKDWRFKGWVNVSVAEGDVLAPGSRMSESLTAPRWLEILLLTAVLGVDDGAVRC